MLPTTLLFGILAALGVQAATKEEWRSRAIYQVLTDRFAPSGSPSHCENTRNYCGGTWRGLADKLDYIQGMGFDAVWISPTGAGIEGETKWGENYHGYWVVDPASPNSHFGTQEDLEYLSKSLHDRGMYLMVDVVPNHLASTTTDISDDALATKEGGRLMFKHNGDYHPACDINWGNAESEQKCWLAQDGVALMDLATETPAVADKLDDFIRNYTFTGLFDGYRVDAVKHMSKDFLHSWCQKGGNFCIGEYYDGSTQRPAELTQGEGIDSVFGFGMMWGAVKAFAQGGGIQDLVGPAAEASSYGDPSVVGAILDNHDLPRFGSLTQDMSRTYNALTLQFLFSGIPTTYYGFEADITFGSNDPDNRDPLWHHTDYSTTGETYGRIKRLNQIRQALGKRGDFFTKVATTKAQTDDDVAFERNDLLMVLTKRGAGAAADWAINEAGFDGQVVDLLTCKTFDAENGTLNVRFDNGMPLAFVSAKVANETGLCQVDKPIENGNNQGQDQPSVSQVSQDSQASQVVNQAGDGPDTAAKGDGASDEVAGASTTMQAEEQPGATGQAGGVMETSKDEDAKPSSILRAQTIIPATLSTISQAGIVTVNKTTDFQTATTLAEPSTRPTSKACKRSRRHLAGKH